MYQHQHAPLPLERLKDVPQPVVVLLEKLLEKDLGRRFQTPNQLLKAIPTITGAIDARRRISSEPKEYAIRRFTNRDSQASHPRIAPAVSPAINWRCSARYTAMIGAIETINVANS